MKNLFYCAASALLLASSVATAQSASGWEDEVRKFDGAYWQAYNQCDVKAMEKMSADDMEFYHDAGGMMLGKAQFAAAMNSNICGNPNHRVRREAIANTVQVYPMRDKGQLYGAIISGEHQFYNAAKGGAETPGSRARFTHMLLMKNGTWTVSRVLSYAHAAPPHDNKLTAIELPTAALDRLAGSYKAKDGMLLVVKRADTHIEVAAGGTTFVLFPSSPDTFFLKERPIVVSFSQVGAGKEQGLTVRERGAIVAEATRAN